MAKDVTVYGSGSNTTIGKAAYSGVWDTVHDAAGMKVFDPVLYGAWYVVISGASKSSTGLYGIYRSYLYFDLSSIAAGSEIGTVQLHLHVSGKAGAAPSTPHPGDLHITQGVQDDPVSTYPDGCTFDPGVNQCSSYNYGDQLPYTTSWGYIAHNDIVVDQYNIITLNAVGKAALNLGGLQKFCIRVRADLYDEPVVGSGETDTINYWSQEKGGDYRPKLVFSEAYTGAFPTADITRVTAIRHIYRPGLFRMEVTLGDVQNAVDMIDSRTELGVPGPKAPLWERMQHVIEMEKAAGVHWTQTGKVRTVPPDWETRISPGQPVVPYQYTPEVPQPFPPTPTPPYTPEAPQPTYVPPLQPSPLDIFKEKMWGFMKDPITAITETWGRIKWW